MDPTVAALAGAFIGMIGTLVSPSLTARHHRKERRRAAMKQAYAAAMHVVSDVQRMKSLSDVRDVRERLFAAQVQIRLVGSQRAGDRFDHFVEAVDLLFEATESEVAKFRPFANPQKRAERAFPPELREMIGTRAREFIVVARRDTDSDDSIAFRSYQKARQRLTTRRNRAAP